MSLEKKLWMKAYLASLGNGLASWNAETTANRAVDEFRLKFPKSDLLMLAESELRQLAEKAFGAIFPMKSEDA